MSAGPGNPDRGRVDGAASPGDRLINVPAPSTDSADQVAGRAAGEAGYEA